jgi:hypothetical protein
MQTITLSASAVAVLRFRVKGWRFPIKDREAFQELVDAGIMMADGDDYRFTEDGLAQKEAVLSEAEDRIERERFEPPGASDLSEDARKLLRQIATGEHTEVTRENRPLFRELAAARIVFMMHTFAHGDESGYRFTYWGWRRRFELLGCAVAET